MSDLDSEDEVTLAPSSTRRRSDCTLSEARSRTRPQAAVYDFPFTTPPTSLPDPDVAHPPQEPIRSTMSNVLLEFCILIDEDRLNLKSFREHAFDPSVGRILDALRDGDLKNEDQLRRDASLWLMFLRTAMMDLEDLGEQEDEIGLNDTVRLRQREQDATSLRAAIMQKGMGACLSVSPLSWACARAEVD